MKIILVVGARRISFKAAPIMRPEDARRRLGDSFQRSCPNVFVIVLPYEAFGTRSCREPPARIFQGPP